jgi:hypothetical protein
MRREGKGKGGGREGKDTEQRMEEMEGLDRIVKEGERGGIGGRKHGREDEYM